MKTKLLLLAILVMTIKSYGQFTFGVSPGIGLNGASFGYKMNSKIVPFVGFQFMSAKFKIEQSGEEYDYDLNQIVSFSRTIETSGSLYIPNIGLKYFVKEENKIKAYLSFCISKPFISAKIKNDNIEDETLKENLKNINIFGSELGFGVEYSFDENFSVAGEFGLRYLYLKYSDDSTNKIYDPNTNTIKDVEIKNSMKYVMSPTFSKIALNYYF